jgi:MoaA/NifB/PqqE/SkfB family radical SAM enzyme
MTIQPDDDIGRFDWAIKDLFNDAWRITLKNPAQAFFFLKAVRTQRRAARVRRYWSDKGVQVPAVMIISVTNRCNLQCVGCYARALHRNPASEMGEPELRKIIRDARALGVAIIFLAGGEPLIRSDVLKITGDFPDIIFPLFTNGVLLDDERFRILKRQKNVIPVLSLEGYQDETDDRRGNGVYERLRITIRKIKRLGIFWGISFTVTSLNFSLVVNEGYIKNLLVEGCRAFFFVEYVPVRDDTEGLVLTEEQKAQMVRLVNGFRSQIAGLFVMFPGDEEEYGGCLSAGRGFVHVNADGGLEPCPFAPYSDVSLKELTLKEALQSEFLKKIRDHHNELKETAGGCALWAKRDWVRTILP